MHLKEVKLVLVGFNSYQIQHVIPKIFVHLGAFILYLLFLSSFSFCQVSSAAPSTVPAAESLESGHLLEDQDTCASSPYVFQNLEQRDEIYFFFPKLTFLKIIFK